jgi:hypothetical protein
LIKDLNKRTEKFKLGEENTVKTLQDIGIANDFLNRTPVSQEIRAKIDE